MFTRSTAGEETGKARSGVYAGSLLKIGRGGCGRNEWVYEAIRELRGEDAGERIGVWLEEASSVEGAAASPAIFRGEVWEKGTGNVVLEWTRLRVDAPLRIASLRAGLSCEYEIKEQEAGVILGPELQMRRVLWVPVMVRRMLRGLVMEGTLNRKRALPCAKAEAIADQLAVLLELEEERRLAAGRKADLDFWLRIKRLLSENHSTNMILGQLTESCTRGESMGGAGAVFAVIGERKSGASLTVPPGARSEDHLLVRAQSGDPSWEYSVNGGPLDSLWRQVIEEGRVACVEADPLPLAKDIAVFAAIPMEQGSETTGVLLAGLPRRKASLETLDRLVWRAELAAEVLEQEQRVPAGLQEQVWRKALVEAREEPAILVDQQGLVAGISRGAQELLHSENGLFVPDQEPGRFAELFLPRDWDEVQGWVDGAQKDSGSGTRAHKSELKGGTKVTLKRLDLSGQGFSVVGLERVHKQKEVPATVENLETMQQAIEWLEEGVVVFDERGKILTRNTMFLQLLGVAGDNAPTLLTLEDVIHAASKNARKPSVFAADWRALSANCAEGTQEDLEMEKPVPQTIERYARPIIGPTGKKLGRVEVYRGMSTWRMFESKMARTEELASLGQSVTRIVHELNNPLTTILGNAQRMVQRGNGNGHFGEACQILQEAERASVIVKQLLNLPRDNGPEVQMVSINELVESTMELQRMSLAGSHLRLKMELEEGLPRVKGDQGQLQQVLLNLAQNAQQAMQESGIGSLLTVRTTSEASGRVKLEVQDDGPGIPEAVQRRMFEPFFTTKPAGKGTGLGLAIVNGFVRQHGGTVSVSSPRGGGACFQVELPAAEKAWQEARREEMSGYGEIENLSSLPSEAEFLTGAAIKTAPRILVVEDEPTVAALIGDVLREEGMQVDVLVDGEKALEMAQQTSYDLAICDVRMPAMDGQVFFAALEKEQNPLRENILFVTGDELEQRTHDFLARHHLPHVAKPFRVEELCRAVRSLLWGKRQSTRPCSEAFMEKNLGTGRGDEGNRDSTE